MPEKINKLIANAYFIGGSPCCGKSTIARLLSEKYGLKYFKIDDYEMKHVKQAKPDSHPVMYKFSQMSWEEIWMRPVELQVEEEFEFYRERMDMILDELNDFAVDSKVIMESAALLPELLAELEVDNNRAIFMIPTMKFQLKYYSKREFIKGILDECSDPKAAFDNWMERDYRFGRKVQKQAQELGYKVLEVDGSKSIKDNMKIVSSHFGLNKITDKV